MFHNYYYYSWTLPTSLSMSLYIMAKEKITVDTNYEFQISAYLSLLKQEKKLSKFRKHILYINFFHTKKNQGCFVNFSNS